MKFLKYFLRGLVVMSGALAAFGMIVFGLFNLCLWASSSIEHAFGKSPEDAVGIVIGGAILVYMALVHALIQYWGRGDAS